GQFLADWRSTFKEGAIGGDPGDRYLHSHSRRIRGITEQEYQRHDAASWRASSAIEVVFASLGLALALQASLMKRPAAAAEGAGHAADGLTAPSAGSERTDPVPSEEVPAVNERVRSPGRPRLGRRAQ